VRIGEVAEQAGVNVETLRYYERRGLLKEAQSLGFSLAEIEEYSRVTRRDPSPPCRSS
jgi:DNA-binding transcriptional MerR regulator